MSRLKRTKLRRKRKKRFFLVISLLMLVVLILGIVTIPKILDASNVSELNIPIFSSNTRKSTNHSNSQKTSTAKKNITNLDGYLFVGDSYTVLLQDTIKEYNPNAIIKAVSGVQPSYWLEHFNELPKNNQVNGVVLLIGVNGVTYSNNLPDKEKLISSLVKKYPDKNIYVQEVFPVGKNFKNDNPEDFNEAIDENNEITKKYCNNYNNVFYINATDNLITDDGYLKFTTDGLHIAPDKQETFYKNILAAINNSK